MSSQPLRPSPGDLRQGGTPSEVINHFNTELLQGQTGGKGCLAPLLEAVIPVRVDQGQSNYQVGLLEQAKAMPPFGGLLVGRTLVDLTSDRIPLRVMNLSRQQMTIPKGAEVCR